MRALKICLWIAGILFLLGLFGMFLPVSTWQSIAGFFGVKSPAIVDSPITEYMLRVALAMSAAIGAYLIILARNPMKYPYSFRLPVSPEYY